METKLTAKQELFVKEYLIDSNATQAAIRAGYSEDTAGVIGYENLKKPYLAELIEKDKTKVFDKAEITAEYILKGIKGIAEEIEAKNSDKLKALELLGRYKTLFSDKKILEITDKAKTMNELAEKYGSE